MVQPTSNGFQRLDEGESTRDIKSKESDSKIGRNCTCCKKFFRYLTNEKHNCISCQSRLDSLKK